jgi:hypothetical protein
MSLSIPIPPELIRTIDESIRADLEGVRNNFFVWLLVFTGLVLLGVLMEEADETPERKTKFDLIRGIPTSNYRLSRVAKRVSKIGWALVVVGVLGELVMESYVSRADALLLSFNDTVISDATRQASLANERAEEAAESAAIDKLEIATTQKETALAKQEAANAKLEAARAAVSAAQSKIQAAGAQKTAEDERLTRMKLEETVASRTITITTQSNLDLGLFAGTRVFLTYVSEDSETRRFAGQVYYMLHEAGWQVVGVKRTDEDSNGMTLMVQGSLRSWNAEQGLLFSAGELLACQLQYQSKVEVWEHPSIKWPTDIPTDVLYVRIGLKPEKYFDEKFQKEFEEKDDRDALERLKRHPSKAAEVEQFEQKQAMRKEFESEDKTRLQQSELENCQRIIEQRKADLETQKRPK